MGRPLRLRLGVVAEYDAARGLGTVHEAFGDEHMFHCTAIADGSRLIDPGAAVAFVLERAVGARVEARSLTKLER